MSAVPLVIITTRLPPATCGIGTHSWLLRKNWPNESRPVKFLVVEGVGTAAAASCADKVAAFNNSASALARELAGIGTADVVLHYAGRAYHRFGFPLWMPGVLARWKSRFRDSRLMIFVHEMPGDAPWTSRHFWFAKAGNWTIARLAKLADVLVTNSEVHRAKLAKMSGRKDVHWFPVGSNIEVLPWSLGARARGEFALFGLPFGRLQTLRLFEAHLRGWHRSGRMSKLHLIGPENERFAAEANELLRQWVGDSDVVHHGVLSSSDVAGLLQRVELALTNASSETWSKSTTFMGGAANGCPLVVKGARGTGGPLVFAVEPDEVEAISQSELAGRGVALAEWYRLHADWRVTAAQIAGLLPERELTR